MFRILQPGQDDGLTLLLQQVRKESNFELFLNVNDS